MTQRSSFAFRRADPDRTDLYWVLWVVDRVASLAVRGLGLIVVGGQIAGALTAAASRRAAGVTAGALMGMRIPELRGKQHEESVREGSTLIPFIAGYEHPRGRRSRRFA